MRMAALLLAACSSGSSPAPVWIVSPSCVTSGESSRCTPSAPFFIRCHETDGAPSCFSCAFGCQKDEPCWFVAGDGSTLQGRCE
jgi:hypothetical protein